MANATVMATGDDFNAEFNFIWKIKNFSYCLPWTWVRSPTFTVESMENTRWCLQLWPKEYTNGIHMEYYLAREEDDSGPEFVRVAFELSFLDSYGIQLLKKSREATFSRDKFKGFAEFVEQAVVYTHRSNEYLPEDTLTACCRMKRVGGHPLKHVFCTATTEIGLEQSSFDWNIENFSKIRPGMKRKMKNKKPFIKLDFSLTPKPQEALQFEISHAHMDEPNMTDCEISIMSAFKDTLYSKRDSRYLEGKVWEFPIFVKKSHLTTEKNIYLRKDTLTLKCCISISLGVISSVIDGYRSLTSSHEDEESNVTEECPSTGNETISSAKQFIGELKKDVQKLFNGEGKNTKEILEEFSLEDSSSSGNESSSTHSKGSFLSMNEIAFPSQNVASFSTMNENSTPTQHKESSSKINESSSPTQTEEYSSPEDETVGEFHKINNNAIEEIASTSNMKNELQRFYQDGTFSDINLTAGNETFLAHRLILSLKSRTFKELFMMDLSNRNIYLPALDPGTLRDLLDFIYTNKVDNMSCEKAQKLILAAESYQVISLKEVCLSFLKENTDVNSACSVLLFADEQQNEELKQIALKFIVSHGKVIMNTGAWDELTKKNIKLAFEAMQQMYLGKA